MSGPWEIGDDGWPTSPDHPANRDEGRTITRQQHLEQLHAREVARLERVFLAGDKSSLAEVVLLCGKCERPLPHWAVVAIIEALKGSRFKGEKHYTRWDAVRELRERKEELASLGYKATWEAAYENAAEMLKGTAAQGEPEAIKKSYEMINRLMKAGRARPF